MVINKTHTVKIRKQENQTLTERNSAKTMQLNNTTRGHKIRNIQMPKTESNNFNIQYATNEFSPNIYLTIPNSIQRTPPGSNLIHSKTNTLLLCRGERGAQMQGHTASDLITNELSSKHNDISNQQYTDSPSQISPTQSTTIAPGGGRGGGDEEPYKSRL